MIDTFGWISSVCFSVCGIPQAYISWKQKHSDGVSWVFLVLWIVGEITGSIYAIAIGAYPLLVNYLISFVCALIISHYKFVKR